MSRTKDYLIELMNQPPLILRRKYKETNHVPKDDCKLELEYQVSKCLQEGIPMAEAMTRCEDWNKNLQSPTKAGLVKKAVFEAYRAAGKTSPA